MSKNYTKKPLKPIFEVKKPNIKFDEKAEKEKETLLMEKMKKFRIYTNTQYKKDFNIEKKKKLAKNKVRADFIQETFVKNPYVYIKNEQDFREESELTKDIKSSKQKILEAQIYDTPKIKQLEAQLQAELCKSSSSHKILKSNEQIEWDTLQGTKGLNQFDCWKDDLDPEDWLQICKNDGEKPHAKCPYFKNGAYIWVDVRVLDYDKEQKKFHVELLGLEKEFKKYVGRLSLYFLKEDYQKFKQRVHQCKFYQQRAENQLVLIKYIESINDIHVSPLPTPMINQILSKLLIKKNNPQYHFEQTIISGMMKIVRTEYLREMKKCFVQEELKDPNKRAFFAQKKIQMIEENPQRIDYDIILKSDIKKSFASKLEQLNQKNMFKNQNVQNALKLFQQKCYENKKTPLLNLTLSNKLLPHNLQEYIDAQREFFNKNKEGLKTQWKEYPLGDICDLLRKVPQFSQSFNDIEEYHCPGKNSLQKLIFRIDLSFRNHLRDFFAYNVEKWLDLLRNFVVPLEGEKKWRIQEVPFIKVQLRFREGTKKKKKKEEEELIYFEPSLETVKGLLREPIKWLQEFINQMKKLESDIVKVLGIPATNIFNIEDDYPVIHRAYELIDNYLERAFVEPNKVLEDFQKYRFLMENSTEDIIRSYTDNMKGKQSVTELENYLEKINQSVHELSHLSSNQFNTPFIQVLSQNIKEHLIGKANQIKMGFLKKVSELVVKDIKSITNMYSEMEENFKRSPESEDELKQLNENIAQCDERLDRLEHDIENTYSYILLMERYGQKFEPKEMYKFWFLKICPLEVKRAYNEAKRVSQEKEQLFVNNLEEEKKLFERDIAKYKNEYERLKMFSDYTLVNEFAKISNDLGMKLDAAKEKRLNFNERESLFNIPKSLYENLDKLAEDFKPYRVLWEKAVIFDNSKDSWFTQALIKLQPKKIQSELDKIKKEISKNLVLKFQQEANANALTVCSQLVDAIKVFEQNLPLIYNLTQDCMTKKPNNWKTLFNTLALKTNQQNTTLRFLIQNGINSKLEIIEEFVEKASKEYKLEEELNKQILDQMENLQLSLILNKPTNSFLIDKIEEVQEKLDELLSSIMMMKQNRYVKPIKKKVLEVEKKLIGTQDLLEDWIRCQRSWLYLKPIFASEDLKKKMPVEKPKFDEVDKTWKKIMSQIQVNPKIFDNFDWEKTKAEFLVCNKELDDIQKSLSEYLESKRMDFPRFYFLSDDELIEIISKTKDPSLVIKYLNKCFEGICSLEFKSTDEIVQIISEEGEKIVLLKPINVNEGEKKGSVEKWLSELEAMMKSTMQLQVKSCLADKKTPRGDWIRKWPGQVILAIDQCRWTSNVESAILEGSLEEFARTMQKDLSEIVDMVRKPLSHLERRTLEALIVISVHANYVVQELTRENVGSVDQFQWISQLRYQMSKNELLNVLIMTSSYHYQYEYLGNSSRLVITPLTDRCYRTLMNAFQYFYGGAPEGPAGTGKTETVKDLAKAVAVQCNVFNCTDQINYIAMRKFFKGLAQTGSWCCFDEFNRIKPEVLSVIAVQVRMIQNAIKENKKNFFFEGSNIKLNPSCAINITMNPGYAGRAELPDNLKALFRPCAMMVPDYSLIAEICLYSYGFQNANYLSKKIVMALKLSSEQLSSQKHYDFGMRALKAILVAAGNLKKKEIGKTEDQLCLQALKNVNLPKFTKNDIPLFNSIITDLFPGIKEPKQDWSKLIKEMESACHELQIVPKPVFLNKAIEIYEMILVRHGLMVVGSTMAGKTSCLNVLQMGLGSFEKPVDSRKINPKAVTGFQLYGYLNPDTKVWTEGVIPQVMKDCENDSDKNEYKWIVFDGPVDAEWIENMNTVLDDNKVLCLTNGQKIKLTNQMTMMFEVEDLISASPATVSRCGMILMEPYQLGWKSLIKKFLQFEMRAEFQVFQEIFMFNLKWFYASCLSYLKKYCKLPLQINDLKLVSNSLEVIKILLREYEEFHSLANFPKEFENKISDLCLYSVIWGMGGVLEQNYRKNFNDFVFQLIFYVDVKTNLDLDIELKKWEPRGITNQFKDSKNIFSYKLNIQNLEWNHWLDTGKIDISSYLNLRFEELIIPTQDSERTQYFIKSILQNDGHIILVGPTGTGKTVGAVSLIQKDFVGEKYSNILTNFSGQTLVNSVQKQIESKMTTRKGRKGCWGPEENKHRLVVFIDDINMPAKEVYGAQPPIELLRMWMDYRFWYDLESKEEKYLQGIQFVSTMGPPSSGRNSITARFLRQFFISYIISFDNESMKQIYEQILEWHFHRSTPKFQPSLTSMKSQIVQASLDLYNKIKANKQFLPTPKKSHYIFSMRDITRVYQTISKATFRSFKREQDFVKLWAYESTRVFMDRLVCQEDKDVFMDILKGLVKSQFNLQWEQVVKEEPLLWGDFMPMQIKEKNETKEISGIYVELSDKSKLKDFFNKKLNEFNEEQQDKLNLVMFMEAIEHVIQIMRVITTPNSHVLLVGLGGLGRKSLTSLASYITQFTLKVIKMSHIYGYKEWVSDLQEILKDAGANNVETIFMFQDSEIFQENILEDVSSLLQQGEVPGIFPNEEKGKIIDMLSKNYEHLVENLNNNQKLQFFHQKCKENLHLCLCFSPVGEDFRRRLRNFPSFINNTTINWFLEWPEEALNSVAKHYLQFEGIPEEEMEKVCELCVRMQKDALSLSQRFYDELRRHYYVTPTSYLELLQMFQKVFRRRRERIQLDIDSYDKGVKTLQDAKQKVDKMKQDIIELAPKLEEANQQTKLLIEKVQQESIEVDDKKAKVEQEEIVCNKNREQAEELKAQCKSDLDKVEPLLDEASKNLKTIQRNHIDFIKSIKTPLPPIKKLFQGLCTLYNIDPKNIPKIKDPNDQFKKINDYTTPTRNIIMAKPDQMIKELLSYNADVINEMDSEIIRELKTLAKDPEFDLSAITNISQAAGKIAGFLLTIIEIYDKLQIINPKREALKKAEGELAEAEKILSEKQQDLSILIEKINNLNRQLNEAKDKQNFLQSEMERCKRQKNAAEELLTGLDGERKQWEQNIIDLQKDSETLTGDVLASSGIMAYFGIFPINYREETKNSWLELFEKKQVKFSSNYDLKNIMVNDIVIGNWTNKQMLPNDAYSVDNAIIMENSNRFCIMIDPQNQANRWLKEMEKDNGLNVLKPNRRSNEIQGLLQLAIEKGHPVLFENLEEKLDYNVISILRNKRKVINKKVKFKFLEWLTLHDQFRFYGTTKLSKPHYSPDICVMTTLLNFQVTPLGLEDQMLNILVAKEDPSSEKMRINNIKEFFDLKKKQKQTEENILRMLTQKGDKNILDDNDLIQALRKSKEDANNAIQRIKVIESMKKKLQNTRNFYSKAANRASNLFFCVADLGNVEPMYQYSLDWFIETYKQSLISENKNKDTRVEEIIQNFTKMLFRGVSPSLFEKDKILFSFLIYLKTLECEQLTNQHQLRKFFIGGTKVESKSPNLLEGFVSEKQWAELEELSNFEPQFSNLMIDIQQHKEIWIEFVQREDFVKASLPHTFSNASDVSHLMLVRILKPDQLIPLIQEKIQVLLGTEFVDFPSQSIEQIYQKTKNIIPIIFILQQGAEPLADIERLSETLGKGKNIDVLSLGQGQEQNATDFIDYAMKKGRWIVLQNCHIAPQFLFEIEKMIEGVEHNEFRLWLTSMPTSNFPVTLLQKGLKVTSQPPRGIKGNLLKTFSSFTAKLVENHPKSKIWKKLLYGISFFHSIVQERRKFASLGWNIPYEFSYNDLYISLTQTNKMIKDFDDIPWDTLTYSIAEANYGGRVTDPMDRRLIKVILNTFMSSKTLKDDYKYSSSGVYFCPEEMELKLYKKFIQENIPFKDNPEIFGLHPNAEITSGIKETNQMMHTLLELLPRSTSTSGISLDQQIIIKSKEILQKLPQQFDVEKIMLKFPIKYENSMNTVLVQELMRYNSLTHKINVSLNMLIKAIEGFVIMSEELDEVYNKIFNNQVSDSWHKFSYPSVKPLSGWINNLLNRLNFMQDWINNGQPPSFWISGFFFTQSFLTGVLQNYSRKHKIAIDCLDFDYKMLEKDFDDSQPPLEGSYIYGLYLEGARWNEKQGFLEDQEPKELYSKAPKIWFIPKKQDLIQKKHAYNCPVYKTSSRAGTLSTTGHSTNFVISITIPMQSQNSEDFWIKRGVAMLCELDN